jgi:hypothetical protein
MDKPTDKWKMEQQRIERQKRFESMKEKDGTKRPVTAGSYNRRNKIVFRVVALVAVLAVVVWSLIQLGIPGLVATPVKVGAVEIKGPEYGFYYSILLSQYYIDPTSTDGKAYLAEKSTVEGSTDKTWKQYFQQQAAEQIRDIVIQSENAKVDGMSLTDTEVQSIQDSIDSFVSNQGSESAAITYLETNYAKGLNLENLKTILERQFLATKYATAKQAGFEITDAQITAKYVADKGAYDLVSFRSFFVKTTYATDATADQKTAADLAAKAKASALLAQVTDEASFKALYEANTPTATPSPSPSPAPTATPVPTGSSPTPSPTPSNTPTPTPTPTSGPTPTPTPIPDPSLDKDVGTSTVSYLGTDVNTWIYDANRKAGDKAVVAGTSGTSDGYYVILFLNRRMDDDALKTVRHILISAARATATEAEIAKAKTDAEAILAQITDEASFIALAKTKSADTGSAAEGGLIAGFSKGQMVAEFENWAFAASRKAGDKGIVQTDYGFHIMYFVKSTPSYRYNIESTLRTDAMTAFMKEQQALDKYKLVTSQSAMNLY